MSNTRPVIIVQGGQWGSEAKGMVAGALALREPVDVMVRTGSINAGHTVYFNNRAYKMQQLPVGWVNPNTRLVIGPGAYIHLPTLDKEIQEIKETTGEDVRRRLYIDERCSLHLDEAEMTAQVANRHHSIGATGKGCAEAIMQKIAWRGSLHDKIYAREALTDRGIRLVDTPALLRERYEAGEQLLLEGTQGAELDLHQGPYPYTTSRMTNAANWVAEAGLSPALDYDILLVCRTYPIRVAGNSGPMPNEISWPILARKINERLEQTGKRILIDDHTLERWENACFHAVQSLRQEGVAVPSSYGDVVHQWDRSRFPVASSELHARAWRLISPEDQQELGKLFEMTTVTKKLRRLAYLHLESLRKVVQREAPREICLTFFNYEFPECWGLSGDPREWWRDEYTEWLESVEWEVGCPINTITTGPLPEHFIDITNI